MQATSSIILEPAALRNNLDFLGRLISPRARLSSVVKGNAYGHGIETFVPLAEASGVRHFSVFSADEAYRVRQCAGEGTEILVMGDLPEEALEWAVSEGIGFFAFEEGRLHEAMAAAKRAGRPAKVHVEAETGMHRTGFEPKEWPAVARLLRGHPELLAFDGLCTHFAGAESIANYVRIEAQQRQFAEALRFFEQEGLRPRLRHACCSAAAIRHPGMHLDLVRIGILQYGFWPSREIFIEYLKSRADKADPLRRVISWKSRIMSVKEVETGEFIGYGTSYLAHRPMRIGLVPVGYAHGFSRSLSNHGRVLVRGMRLSVVGMVNMNCMAIDLSDLPGAERGDEVVLIGRQGKLDISVASFGEMSDQLNYELLTRLPQAIPRRAQA
jgi:alanine racemase